LCGLPGNPTLRVSEVAFTVGFGSIPQFNSVFKRLAGKSPTEFRSRLEQSPQGAESRARGDVKGLSAQALPAAEEADIPDNVIRAAAFRREEVPAGLPDNIIRPRLKQHPRRAARA
jgi:hypothetical protein